MEVDIYLVWKMRDGASVVELLLARRERAVV